MRPKHGRRSERLLATLSDCTLKHRLNKQMPNILVADDHSVFRLGLSVLLRQQLPGHEVLEAAGFDQAIELLERDQVELGLFDLDMPGMAGPGTLLSVTEMYPDMKVAIVSSDENQSTIDKTIDLKFSGYIPKRLGLTEIVKALHSILNNEIFDPRRSLNIVHRPGALDQNHLVGRKLTQRQEDVLYWLQQGLPNKVIAKKLNIAPGTVKIHMQALFEHYKVHNRTQLLIVTKK